MNHFMVIFVASTLFLTSYIDPSVAQVIWMKDTLNNPVLSPGEPGEWDAGSVQVDAVIFDDATYHMWYTGGFSAIPSIGYATSPDGIHWVKDTVNNPVFTVGEPGQWDEDVVASVSILFHDNTYHMWYTGGGNGQIGYATSPDGINWTRNPNNPVLSPGAPGSWDDQAVQQPVVLLDGDTLRMWYHGTQNFYNFNIGYATSVDGIVWAKNASNPVLEIGSQGEWDSRWTISPFVIQKDAMFQMWYSGNDGQISHFGYATSPDGIHWTKDTLNNPVLSPGEPGEWDSDGIGSPTLLFNDPVYRMWYFGANNNILRVGHAASLPSTIIRVPQDQPSIQAGIDAAADGNTVLVEDGTYLENINFKGKAITVASHYIIDGDTNHIANTIIDGSQPSNPDSGSVVYFISGEDTNSVLCGFTITGGTGTYDNFIVGGGILCLSGATICHNKIINNSLSNTGGVAFGGGISAGSPFMTDHVHIKQNTIGENFVEGTNVWGGGIWFGTNGCILGNIVGENVLSALSGTTSGGGIGAQAMSSGGTYVLIKDNVIRGNTSKSLSSATGCYGGGLDIYFPTVELIGNTIESNTTSSIPYTHAPGFRLIYTGEGSVVDGNVVKYNREIGTAPTVSGGGIALYEASPKVTNNIVAGNGATLGSGVRIISLTAGSYPEGSQEETAGFALIADEAQKDSPSSNRSMYLNKRTLVPAPIIINNTIVGNVGGAGIHSSDANLTILNTILWGNAGGSIEWISGTIDVRYSDVAGGWSGDGNINAEPFFIDPIDYQLSDSSLCIGAGIDSIEIGGTWYYAPPTDMGGNPRPNPSGSMPDMGTWESPLGAPAVSGQNWTAQNTGITEHIWCVDAVDQNIVWGGAENGVFLRTTDGGLNWTSGTIPSASSQQLLSVVGVNSNTAYFATTSFAGGDTRIYKTTDGGAAWTMQYQNTNAESFFNSINFWDDQHGIAIGDPVNGSFLVVTTTDGGNSWVETPGSNIPTPLPGEFAGFGDSGGRILEVQGSGNAWFGTGYASPGGTIRVLRSTDGGQNWTVANTPLSTTGSFYGIGTIAFKDAMNGFAGGGDVQGTTNTMVATTDGGQTWNVVSSFPPAHPQTLVVVPGTGNSTLVATLGPDGSCFSTDGGDTWTTFGTQYLIGLTFIDSNTGWAAGLPAGSIYEFTGQLVGIDDREPWQLIPEQFVLQQSYPNPFNPSATIAYQVPQQSDVRIEIYNTLGQKVRTLLNDHRQPGLYKTVWDGRNDSGAQVASGVYLYRMVAGDFVQTRKMIFLK